MDTSALVKLYVEEKDREAVFEAVEDSDLVATSVVAYAEARAAFAKKKREGALDDEGHRRAGSDLDEDWETFERLVVSEMVARLAGEFAERHALRGFDAVHLASAVRIRGKFEDLRFMAFDERLTQAARKVIEVHG